MTGFLRAGLVLICIAAMVGCTSLRVISDGSPAASASLAAGSHRIATGDSIRLTLRSGEVKTLAVSSYGPEGIEGVEGGDKVSYPAEAIARIERRETSASKTFFLSLGIVALISTLAQAASATSRMVNIP